MVKRTDTRTSHGNECMGDYVTGERCKRSRARTGKPVVLSKKCEKCKEQRCKAHCDCARKKMLLGHKLARGVGKCIGRSTGAPSTHSAANATSHATSLAPVGRAPAPSIELLANAEVMFRQACDLIKKVFQEFGVAVTPQDKKVVVPVDLVAAMLPWRLAWL